MRRRSLGDKSIFYDVTGRRNSLVNAAIIVLLVVGAVIGVISYFGLTYGPTIRQGEDLRAEAPVLVGSAQTATAQEPFSLPLTMSTSAHASIGNAMRLAYFDMFSADSFTSLFEHAKVLDGIFANFLILDAKTKRLSHALTALEKSARRRLSIEAPDLKIYAIIESKLSPNSTAAIISNDTARAQLVEDIANYLRISGDTGVALNLPGLPDSHFGYLVELVRALRATLASNRHVIVMGSAAGGRGRLSELAKAADYIVLDKTGTADARELKIPLSQFSEELSGSVAAVPPEKLIVAQRDLARLVTMAMSDEDIWAECLRSALM